MTSVSWLRNSSRSTASSMSSDLKRLVTSSGLYGLIGVASTVLGAVVVPLYAHAFSPAEYGIVSLVGASVALLAIVSTLGFDTATGRWYGSTDDERDRRRTTATWTAAQGITSLLLASILLALAAPLADALVDDPAAAPAFRWAALILPLSVPGTVAMTVLRLQDRRVAAIALGVVTAVGATGGAATMVLAADWGPSGVFAGQAAGYSVAAVLAVAQLRGWLSVSPASADRLRAMLRFALPLVPAAAAAWIVNLLDRFVLRLLDGTSDVGVYQVAYAVAGLTALATSGFQLAWGPFAFNISRQPDAARTYARALSAYVVGAGLLTAIISTITPALLHLVVPERYASAATPVPSLAISYVFIGLTYIAAIGPSIAGTSAPVAMGTLLAAALTVPLLVLLVPPFGIEGAAIATALSWAMQPAYVFWRGHKLWPVRYRFSHAAAVLLACGIVGQTLNLWRHGNIAVQIVVKFCVLLLLAGTLALTTAQGRRAARRSLLRLSR